MDIKIVFSDIGRIEPPAFDLQIRAKPHHVTFKIRL